MQAIDQSTVAALVRADVAELHTEIKSMPKIGRDILKGLIMTAKLMAAEPQATQTTQAPQPQPQEPKPA